MRDRRSKEFKETADEIIAELDTVYRGKNGYFGCIVLKLLPSTTSRSRNTALKVDASVDITFKASSEIKEDEVVQTLKECPDVTCNVIGKTFETTDLCDDTPCDEKNTNCTSSEGTFSCICNEGYKETNYSTRMCIATCAPGEKLKDNKCVKCSFGYSGFNCSENWQLILVIMGSLLGGLLLIALILLPVVATPKSNKISKKSKSAEMEKPYTNLSSASQPMASNKFGHSQGVSFNRSANGHSGFQNGANSAVPMFPRATTNSWDNRTDLEMKSINDRQKGNGHSGFQNGPVPMFPRAAITTNSWDNRTNLEMKPSNGQQNFGHMNSGSNNPYAQNQPKMNPYIQNQGHSNRHYTHNDGRQY
ncbi:unnamed protein product [Oreochromis niloticus]|nr:unnamed protein product [Mustela putorius furo]